MGAIFPTSDSTPPVTLYSSFLADDADPIDGTTMVPILTLVVPTGYYKFEVLIPYTSGSSSDASFQVTTSAGGFKAMISGVSPPTNEPIYYSGDTITLNGSGSSAEKGLFYYGTFMCSEEATITVSGAEFFDGSTDLVVRSGARVTAQKL